MYNQGYPFLSNSLPYLTQAPPQGYTQNPQENLAFSQIHDNQLLTQLKHENTHLRANIQKYKLKKKNQKITNKELKKQMDSLSNQLVQKEHQNLNLSQEIDRLKSTHQDYVHSLTQELDLHKTKYDRSQQYFNFQDSVSLNMQEVNRQYQGQFQAMNSESRLIQDYKLEIKMKNENLEEIAYAYHEKQLDLEHLRVQVAQVSSKLIGKEQECKHLHEQIDIIKNRQATNIDYRISSDPRNMLLQSHIQGGIQPHYSQYVLERNLMKNSQDSNKRQ